MLCRQQGEDPSLVGAFSGHCETSLMFVDSSSHQQGGAQGEAVRETGHGIGGDGDKVLHNLLFPVHYPSLILE